MAVCMHQREEQQRRHWLLCSSQYRRQQALDPIDWQHCQQMQLQHGMQHHPQEQLYEICAAQSWLEQGGLQQAQAHKALGAAGCITPSSDRHMINSHAHSSLLASS